MSHKPARPRTRIDELVARRKALGLTPTILAARAGIDRGTLYKVERGVLSLPYSSAMRVSALLGCSIWDITELPDIATNPIQHLGGPFDHGRASAA